MTLAQHTLLERIKSLGIKPIPGTKLTASELRQNYISFYQSQLNQCTCKCVDKTDAKYNLQAYQQMTDKEILMSEEREQEYHSQQTQDFLEDLRRFEEESRKIVIWVK